MDWQCSGCNRHYSFTVTECPHCQPVVTVTTGGTQPTDTQHTQAKMPSYGESINAVVAETGDTINKKS